MRKYKFLILILCFSIHSFAFAQTRKAQVSVGEGPIVLSPEEKVEFQQRTLEKINDFQDNLSQMAGKDLSAEEKLTYKDVAAELFINKGKTVVMEVSFKSPVTGKITIVNRPLLVYFDRLCNLPYKRVEFRAAKSCLVSDWKQKGHDSNGNPVYEATATYFQEFIGYGKDGSTYRDITQKSVRVEIRRNTNPDVQHWIVLLGDITVEETA